MIHSGFPITSNFGRYHYRRFDCGAIVFPIWKNASTSLVKNSRSRPIDPQPGALVFVRDPIERLVSYYGYQRRYAQENGSARPPYRDWHHLVDCVLNGYTDAHTRPQVDFMGDGVAKQIVPFENLGLVFPWLPHLNKTAEPVAVDMSYRVDELREFYARDFELRTSE